MTIVRFCHIKNYEGILELENDNTNGFQFKGYLAMFGNSYKDLFKYISRNVTILVDQVGDENQNDDVGFEKCVTRVNQNLSDTLFMPHTYPDDYDNITQGYLMSEQKVNLFSIYYNNMVTKERPLLMMIDSFPLGLWLLIILTFSIFTFILYIQAKIRTKLKKKNKKSQLQLANSAFFEVLFHFIKLHKINSKRKKIMSFTVSLASFFLIFFLTSMIKTDLVVIEEPPIIESYEDMIKYNSSPVFHGLSYLHKLFINPRQADKVKLMKFFRKYRKDNEFYFRFHDLSQLKDNLLKLLRREHTMIAESYAVKLMRENFCELLGKDPDRVKSVLKINFIHHNVLAHISSDPSTYEIKQSLLNKHFTRSNPQIFKLLRIPSETGTLNYMVKFMGSMNSIRDTQISKQMFGPTRPEGHEYIRMCKSDSIVIPHLDIPNVEMTCVTSLVFCCFILDLIAILILLIEIA